MRTNDPPKLPRWTLPQSLAWMIDEAPEAVDRADRKEVFDVANEAIRREGLDDAAQSAALRRRHELFEHLCDGTLTAYGIEQGQSEHRPIPALAWLSIDCFFNYDGRCNAGPEDVYRSGEGLPRYRDVFVRSKDVLALGSVDAKAADAPSGAKAVKVRRPSMAERLARELRAICPGGRAPQMKVKEIRRVLEAHLGIGEIKETTFKKALSIAFPRDGDSRG
jgi:hypothetical protein